MSEPRTPIPPPKLPPRVLTGLVILVAVVATAEVYATVPPPAAAFGDGWSARAMTGGTCDGRSLAYRMRFEAPESLAAADTENDLDWTRYPVYLNLLTTGGRCDRIGNYVGLRHASLRLTVFDANDSFGNEGPVWIAAQDVNYPYSSSGYATGVHMYHRESPNVVLADGVLLAALLDVEWEAVKDRSANVTFDLLLSDRAAKAHAGDRLLFRVEIALTASESACFGTCWSPFFRDSFSEVVDLERTLTVAA